MNGVVVGVDGSTGSLTAGAVGGVGLGDLGAELSTRAGQAIDEALDSVDAGDVPVEQHVLEGARPVCCWTRARAQICSSSAHVAWADSHACSRAPSATRWRNAPLARR
jgi:hypothetical protein